MEKWQLFKYHPKQRVWVDKPQNYKDLYGTLQLLRDSHLDNFPRKNLKLGWVAFHSVMKCLDFQSNQNKKLVPVLSRFCKFCRAQQPEQTSKWRPELQRHQHRVSKLFTSYTPVSMSKSRRGKSASANELSRWETELIQAPFNEVSAILAASIDAVKTYLK